MTDRTYITIFECPLDNGHLIWDPPTFCCHKQHTLLTHSGRVWMLGGRGARLAEP